MTKTSDFPDAANDRFLAASADHITPFVFALIYIGICFGYIISPVHPSLVVTCEYFRISIKDMIQKMTFPTLIVFFTVFLISLIIAR